MTSADGNQPRLSTPNKDFRDQLLNELGVVYSNMLCRAREIFIALQRPSSNKEARRSLSCMVKGSATG